MCLLEAVAWISGQKWSDNPEDVCPILAAFGREWNDGLRSDEERTQLLPYIPLLVGSKSSLEVEKKRAYLAMDWLVRVYAPAWLRLAKLDTYAVALEALSPLVDNASTRDASGLIKTARAAARGAAEGITWVAFRSAASTIRSTAGEATREAVRFAAWEYNWGSDIEEYGWIAYDASIEAAKAAFKANVVMEPTILEMQLSAHTLYRQMISVTG